MSSLEINLGRVDRTYRAGDKVSGSLVLKSDSSFAHSGMTLVMTGTVDLQLSAKSVGLFDAFYNSIKPVTLCDVKLTLEAQGEVKKGVSEYPFEIELKAQEGHDVHDTYHGVYINVTYLLKADVLRKYFGKNLQKSLEFIVEKANAPQKPVKKPESFVLSTDSVETNKTKLKTVPNFSIRGTFESLTVHMDDPLWGFFIVESCDEPIKGVELQLVRLETVGNAEGFVKDATEIQNIQVADGNVLRGIEIPLHMVFPRLFTCPTVSARTFKVDFEMNFILMFPDGRLISKKFPLVLVR